MNSFIIQNINTNNGREAFLYTEDYKNIVHKNNVGKSSNVTREFMDVYIKDNAIVDSNEQSQDDEESKFDWDSWVAVG